MRLATLLIIMSIASCEKKNSDDQSEILEVPEQETNSETSDFSSVDTDGDGILDAVDICPQDAGEEQKTMYADGDGDGRGDSSQAVQLCFSEIESSDIAFVDNGDDTDDTNPSIYPEASCDGISHGEQDSRVRYRLAQAPVAGACESQVQQRVCTDGVWSPWDGDSSTFSENTCNQNPDNPLTVSIELGAGGSTPAVSGDSLTCAYTANATEDADGDEVSAICSWTGISGSASNCSYIVLQGDADASVGCSLTLVDGKGGQSETVASSNSISVERAICNFSGNDYDGSASNGQDGTPAKPYYLCTKAQFDDFLTKCTDVDTSCTHSVSLQTDINFALSDYKATKLAGKTTAYTGEFDGNGHKLERLRRVEITGEDLGGIFATVGAGGVVKNLVIDNFNIIGLGNIGGLVATCDSCTINQIYLDGLDIANLGSSGYTGGLAGISQTSDNANNFGINEVYVGGSIAVEQQVGGVLGRASQTLPATGNVSLIQNIYATTTISSGDAVATGGLIGESSKVLISQSLFAGNMDASISTVHSYGGLIGLSMNSTEGYESAALGVYYSLGLSTFNTVANDTVLDDTSGSQANNTNLIAAMAGFSTDDWKADVDTVNGGISYLAFFASKFEE
ncbi:hypothetical protein [Pseudobacteriovorax antillogorgiicola]|uniref:Uncharacterized protein n=1 Tax=Pseudobacteriovorax antillogorgiicola TaxID=1513793 RepID=A0A1Y6BFM2_9BACT|nr:hypothetical protein [Pseudobacteriovorax antillogorgiicola]TCS56199.1 hypothetical protein EDD56_10421 [Pseudobacteriovorax antillogorgiicola]SMF08697.1 hypothetical protein SAMN06296036_104313 [Pseudobacteriovorax antillogorgiicola]